MKIITYNVAGLRAILKKEPNFMKNMEADIICLQETKINPALINDMEKHLLKVWTAYWSCTEARKGFNGVAILLSPTYANKVDKVETKMPGDPNEFDNEGRFLSIRFSDNTLLVNVYVPNSGSGRINQRLTQWDVKLRNFLKNEQRAIVCGDFNAARKPIDVYNPTGLKNTAGFTKEERESFELLLEETNLVDTFRTFYPDTPGFTFFSYLMPRHLNKGWRIDYFLVSESLINDVSQVKILNEQKGSDHVPLLMEINW
jgi:exodeoxyribonuclease-3